MRLNAKSVSIYKVTGEPLVRRADDNPETLSKRLEAYHRQTTPLIGYYSAQNIVRKIDASVAPNSIFENIKNAFVEMKGTKTQSPTDSRQTYDMQSVQNFCSNFCRLSFQLYATPNSKRQTFDIRALEVDQQYNHPHRLIPLKSEQYKLPFLKPILNWFKFECQM